MDVIEEDRDECHKLRETVEYVVRVLHSAAFRGGLSEREARMVHDCCLIKAGICDPEEECDEQTHAGD